MKCPRKTLPLLLFFWAASAHAADENIRTDLLIVGGTESGCAAAIQAARMGVEHITLVNDIDWLGGQFSAEALVAIDENRGPSGYGHGVPFPRSGLFKEVVDRIEEMNQSEYGQRRPGNTRVVTTCRPATAERVFRNLLKPYVERSQLRVFSDLYPAAASMSADGTTLKSVRFQSTQDETREVVIEASLTIDASDWGDAIKAAGAAYEFGPDLKSKYGESLAPDQREGYPLTDMNPITYCMVIVETDQYEPIPKPARYDERSYRAHRYPKDPLWLYASRRLIDHYHFQNVDHADVLLLCFPAFDYPLDELPGPVVEALERTEKGAAQKNIVQMNRAQRQLVFSDAKQYSLGFLHYLQTTVHAAMEDQTHSFRRFQLSKEFPTSDRMPPKPYVRESLRLKAMYMMRQQDTAALAKDGSSYAAVMYHDGIACWQFEYDFHPTKRTFLEGDDRHGPWTNAFRAGRTWGPPYSGRALFPLRSMVPEKIDGLLGAQKNLGYSSIVGSAVRLHDQSIAIGQAAGAVAAVALIHGVPPRSLPYDAAKLEQIRRGLCARLDGGIPQALWPFRDLQPEDASYEAANSLAIRGGLPLSRESIDFCPEEPATLDWRQQVVQRTLASVITKVAPQPPSGEMTRGAFARAWWSRVRDLPLRPFSRQTPEDADGDGIADLDDPLLFSPARVSLPNRPLAAEGAASIAPLDPNSLPGRRFNFTGQGSPPVEGFTNDYGEKFMPKRGHGWIRDIGANQRQRGQNPKRVFDTFLFTRTSDCWECVLENGRYEVTFCIGDSGHEQPGQHVVIEDVMAAQNVDTAAGRFCLGAIGVEVRDGRLTVVIGSNADKVNTCLNWLVIRSVQ